MPQLHVPQQLVSIGGPEKSGLFSHSRANLIDFVLYYKRHEGKALKRTKGTTMAETIKDKLAEAEFWTFEARNWYDLGTEERAKLNEAHNLVVEVMMAQIQTGKEV